MCYALLIDNDKTSEIHLFDTLAERESFMWDYAFDNSDTESESLDDFKAEYDGDLGEAMGATNDGWNTDERIAPAPPADPVRDAAPAMLAALKALVDPSCKPRHLLQHEWDNSPRIVAARAAIAAAEGAANV